MDKERSEAIHVIHTVLDYLRDRVVKERVTITHVLLVSNISIENTKRHKMHFSVLSTYFEVKRPPRMCLEVAISQQP